VVRVRPGELLITKGESGVGNAVLNHEIDFVAEGFWQPGDFPIVTPVQRGIFDF